MVVITGLTVFQNKWTNKCDKQWKHDKNTERIELEDNLGDWKKNYLDKKSEQNRWQNVAIESFWKI